MIDVTLLGTAALMPLPGRYLASALLTCQGRGILLDCGEGTQAAARSAGVSLMHADVIALTHYHGDHVFGLPGLLQTMSVLGRTQPLHIAGPRDEAGALGHLLALAGPLGFDVRRVPLQEGGIELRALHASWPVGARLSAFPTRHRVPSVGYRLELPRAGRFMPERARALGVPVRAWRALQAGQDVACEGRVISPGEVLGPARRGLCVAYSGDTALCDALVDGARGCDLLVCEATYGEDAQAEMAARHGHMTFAQAAMAARAAGARRLWLTHFSQMVEEPEAWVPAARAVFPGAICGRDGMRMTLRFDDEL